MPRARRLKTIAAWINENLPELEAVIERGYCNTDRKPRDLRYITRKGKGREGNRLKVYKRSDVGTKRDSLRDPVILDHNAAETYRSNNEVESWLKRYLKECRHGRCGYRFCRTCYH